MVTLNQISVRLQFKPTSDTKLWETHKLAKTNQLNNNNQKKCLPRAKLSKNMKTLSKHSAALQIKVSLVS